MSPSQGPSKSALKTSLPSAYAAVNAEQPHGYESLPTKKEQEKYLANRPGANAQHLGIALQHAHQIQAQKVAEEMILDRTVELISIPTSSSADPAAPSTEDARTFKSALFVFRPTDYDNLITERNYEDLCGYGLCPRENRKASANAKGQTFHFKYGAKGSGPGGRGRSVDIVSRDKLEKWCSDECAERALFIRVQLAEAPIWERRADDIRANHIELLEEARAKRQKQKQKQKQTQAEGLSTASVTDGMSNLNIQEDRSQELAIERGDTAPALRNGRIEIQIKEKESAGSSASAPQWKPEDATGGSIEGYVPQERRDQPTVQLDEKDLLDQI
ncbi:uncharacterized protein N7483_006921 [Penicillium malachiteum]|uniref:uncharacterized protein n=1 Tax=Penicillium malachiteum TaxID=1324776 RepID=UPI002548F201|nr:uncharacterized protein N7483_006921 [Penicillium malachiteum]KAJ5725564.1 hypothetical protein N7483_006921 [Penicillium malachiteum]